MKKTHKVVMLATLALGGLFAGCSKSEPVIACGREWNPAVGYVADTGSVFRMADELIIQLRYGTGFDFNTLKFAFYEGTLAKKGEKLWEHDFRVSDKLDAFASWWLCDCPRNDETQSPRNGCYRSLFRKGLDCVQAVVYCQSIIG